MELIIGIIFLVFVSFALFVYHMNKSHFTKSISFTGDEKSAAPIKDAKIIEFKSESKVKTTNLPKNKRSAKNKSSDKPVVKSTKTTAPKGKKQKIGITKKT